MKNVEVTANYSFWKHPIKWIRERRMRKLMGLMINYQWENGMKERVEKQVQHSLFYGGHPIKNEAEKDYCVICKKYL